MIITVLDFGTARVRFHEIDEKTAEEQNIEDILHRWGYEINNVQYIVTKRHNVRIQDLL